MIKHDCEHEGNKEKTSRRPVFSIFLDCSLMSGVFCYSVIRLRLLHWLYDIEVIRRTRVHDLKTIKHAFSMFYIPTEAYHLLKVPSIL